MCPYPPSSSYGCSILLLYQRKCSSCHFHLPIFGLLCSENAALAAFLCPHTFFVVAVLLPSQISFTYIHPSSLPFQRVQFAPNSLPFPPRLGLAHSSNQNWTELNGDWVKEKMEKGRNGGKAYDEAATEKGRDDGFLVLFQVFIVKKANSGKKLALKSIESK